MVNIFRNYIERLLNITNVNFQITEFPEPNIGEIEQIVSTLKNNKILVEDSINLELLKIGRKYYNNNIMPHCRSVED